MPALNSDPPGSNGHLLANLLHFGRLLRRLGLRVSTREIYDLAEALTFVDITRRDDFYYTARSFLVHDPEGLALFDAAFDLFWAGQIAWMLEFGMGRHTRQPDQEALDALTESSEAVLSPPGDEDEAEADEENEQVDPSARATYSPIEILRHVDFADYSEEDLELARRFVRTLAWQLEPRLTRRQVRAAKRDVALDLRRAIRESMKQGGEIVRLPWRQRKQRPRPLVVICDVSGSMERYSRLFLHFMYALVQEGRRVEAFVFGTRLTRITPALRRTDVDAALRETAERVIDWSGGTRIGESLKAFNYHWSRRVLGGGTVAVIISDGWDRGDPALLEREIARLRRSVSRLIWLNPLLGAPDYQPLVRGIRTVLPYIDDFLPFHNLASLESLAQKLGSLRTSGRRALHARAGPIPL